AYWKETTAQLQRGVFRLSTLRTYGHRHATIGTPGQRCAGCHRACQRAASDGADRFSSRTQYGSEVRSERRSEYPEDARGSRSIGTPRPRTAGRTAPRWIAPLPTAARWLVKHCWSPATP